MVASRELRLGGQGRGMSEAQRRYAQEEAEALRKALELLGLFDQETLERARIHVARSMGVGQL